MQVLHPTGFSNWAFMGEDTEYAFGIRLWPLRARVCLVLRPLGQCQRLNLVAGFALTGRSAWRAALHGFDRRTG